MDKKKSVVQDWLAENCSWKQQTVLLAATRGCDGVAKEDPSKLCHKIMRSCILENAGTNNTGFMDTGSKDNSVTIKEKMEERWKHIQAFRKDIDKYPIHYVLHFVHAAEIISYYHPSVIWRNFWGQAYLLFVDAMHLHMESKEECEYRLRDGVDSE